MSLSTLEGYIETGNFRELDLLLSAQPELAIEKTSHDISPLLLACYYQKEQIARVILKHLKTISIHEACAAGLIDQVASMLAQNPSIINELSDHGFSPLGIAAHFGQEDIVRSLLAKGADPDFPSQNGYNVYPIHAALGAGNNNIVKMLIEAGAEVNVVQSSRITPLHLAAQQGNIDIIILLLENGADISIQTDTGQTPSDLAAERGFTEIAEILRA